MLNKLIPVINKGRRDDFMQVISEASQNGTLKYLLRETNSHQESALICAIKKRYTFMAQTMIKIGADVNYVVPTTKKTPLMYATELGNDLLVEDLIKAGAILDQEDFVKKTAYDIAIESGNEEIAKMIATPDTVTELHNLIDEIHTLSLKKPPPPEKQLKFDLMVMKREIEQFKIDLKSTSGATEFIQKYIKDHASEGVTTPSIVFGLILNSAIALEDVQLVNDIIAIIRPNSKTNIIDILTYVDASGCSAVSSTLYSGNQEILTMVGEMIQDLRYQNIDKTYCIPEDLQNLETVVRCPHFDSLDTKTCINNFIAPLYSEESVATITSLLGELD